MRPEISALIRETIYRDLQDAPSVKAYPHVAGDTPQKLFSNPDPTGLTGSLWEWVATMSYLKTEKSKACFVPTNSPTYKGCSKRCCCPDVQNQELTNVASHRQADCCAGVAKDLFFFDHSHPESSDEFSNSKCNEFEVKMIIGLTKYLLKQGCYSHRWGLLYSLFCMHYIFSLPAGGCTGHYSWPSMLS
jgi:hypothetical protein